MAALIPEENVVFGFPKVCFKKGEREQAYVRD